MASHTIRTTLKEVRPILSVDAEEARRRVLALYKAWRRQLPYILHKYDMPKNVEQLREKLREEFLKHKEINDLRVIDMLIIKGQMDLQETVHVWKQKHHIMSWIFKESHEPRPTDFLSKFLAGKD